jgi:hypothetical protein
MNLTTSTSFKIAGLTPRRAPLPITGSASRGHVNPTARRQVVERRHDFVQPRNGGTRPTQVARHAIFRRNDKG